MATKKVTTKKSSTSKKAGAKASADKSAAKAAASKTAVETVKTASAAADALAAAVVSKPAAKPAAVADQSVLSAPALNTLRKLNLWVALLMGAEAAAIVLFGGTKTAPITTQYLATDQLTTEATGHTVWAAATRHLLDLRLSVTAVKPLIVLALCCVVIATIGRLYYETQLKRGSHLARWVSFGLGGGFMVAALAQVSGVSDLMTLILMVVLTTLGFSLEPLAEKFKRENRGGVLPHAICAAAITAVVVPWLVLLSGVVGAVLWDGHLPATTYAMYATTALLFACWALASHFRVRRQGKWADTLYTEKMYIFLTVAASSVLAWQIFAGAL